jgi:hypothetical protein
MEQAVPKIAAATAHRTAKEVRKRPETMRGA